MARQKLARTNFASGELAPELQGRIELPIYLNGLARCENFITLVEGPAKFRTGTKNVFHTRRNNVAFLGLFEYNDDEVYVLEFTEGNLRFYANNGILTETAKNISGATAADPVVVTTGTHGYSNGDEVFIEGVVGMTELNGRGFIVTNKTATTFELYDSFGNSIDGTGYTSYSSGGTSSKVVEVATPYQEEDLFQLKYTQTANTMYIAHPNWEPRKLTRTSATAFTLARYTRTNDPFTNKYVPTAITKASPGVVTVADTTGLANGDEIIFEDIGGMVELNGNKYYVAGLTGTTIDLADADGNDINTSSFTTFSASGNDYFTPTDEFPVTCTFYESSLFFGGTPSRPQHIFKSQSVNPSTGATRYDDFTLGTDADDGTIYALASQKINFIRNFAATDKMIFVGTSGSEVRMRGSTADDAITPTSINARSFSYFGVADQLPVVNENLILFIDRTQRTLRSVEFDFQVEGFVSIDRNLVSSHITTGGINQLTYQVGRPSLLWAVKDDGKLLGVTIKDKEDVSGWHRHAAGGTDAKFTSCIAAPRLTNYDQLWVVVERTINGNTTRYVEYFVDEPTWLEKDDFFTGASNESADEIVYLRAMFEKQKEYIHVDSSLTFDGTTPGSDAGATLTPGATTGTAITFTASAAVFSATDVGKELWRKSTDGLNYGRATIVTYNSSTSVDCDITVDFDSTDAIAAGSWYLTTASVTGLWHLEGETVSIIADGGEHATKTVSEGAISLDSQTSVAHVGLGYSGYLRSMNLEGGGTIGSAQGSPMNIHNIAIQFVNTLGAQYGSSLYRMQDVLFRSSGHFIDRPPPLANETIEVPYADTWSSDKQIIIKQDSPLPCQVQLLIIGLIAGDNS